MSFLNKVLSKVGIGAAKIDAVLDQEQVEPGQQVSGIIHITGGKVDQPINKIDLDVYCNYFVEEEYEEGDETRTRVVEHDCRINSWDLQDSFTIEAGQSKEIPFAFELSHFAPLSLGKSQTWLKTNLDIDFALDKADKDYLDIRPNQLQAATLDALMDLGFNMVEAESEGCSSSRGDLPFIQEFEFKATAGDFRGKLDEVELVMFVDDDSLEIFLEIDRRARGIGGLFAEAFGMDETNVRLKVTTDDIDELGNILYETISQHC